MRPTYEELEARIAHKEQQLTTAATALLEIQKGGSRSASHYIVIANAAINTMMANPEPK